mgnify:CR=1 FL=1
MKELDIENRLPHPSEKLKINTVLEKNAEAEPFNYSTNNLNY